MSWCVVFASIVVEEFAVFAVVVVLAAAEYQMPVNGAVAPVVGMPALPTPVVVVPV